jgi:hypothetical protein
MSAIQRIGDPYPPKLIETLRIGAGTVLSILISLSAAADSTATKASNIKSLIMLMVSGSMASYALLDAVKPDKEKDARKALNLVKAEADVIVAEATEYWARMNPSAFTRGELPSDTFIDAFARNLVQEEGDVLALPSSEVEAFEPSVVFNPSVLEVQSTRSNPSIPEVQSPLSNRSDIKPTYHEDNFSFTDTGSEFDWIQRLISPSALLIFGGDGSGKTTFTLDVIRQRQDKGHRTIALDPHAHPGKWPGCEVIGGGLGFPEIKKTIANLQILIHQRYSKIQTGDVKPCGFQPITLVCEEMTDWVSSVDNAELLILKMGDYRKVNLHLIMVAHGDTMSQIAAPQGSNEVIKNCLTKLRLFSKPGKNGEPVPAFKGQFKPPLQNSVDVEIPQVTPITSKERPEILPKVSKVIEYAATSELPIVNHQTFESGFEYTDPNIFELLEQHLEFKAMVEGCLNAGGKQNVLALVTQAKTDERLKRNGKSFNSDDIRLRFKFLQRHYPKSFELADNDLSLKVVDPGLLNLTDAC